MCGGRLRVLLGAAPGVEKTFAMLPDEGYRLQQEGNDVVVDVVNTHDRGEVAVLLVGLEKVQPLKSTGPADCQRSNGRQRGPHPEP
ncbi:MAG TPA: hypothetical protein VIG24_16000, partial [Acidimicrobiia bacterium]